MQVFILAPFWIKLTHVNLNRLSMNYYSVHSEKGLGKRHLCKNTLIEFMKCDVSSPPPPQNEELGTKFSEKSNDNLF